MCLRWPIKKIKHLIGDLCVYQQLSEVLFVFSFSVEVTNEVKNSKNQCCTEEKLQLTSLRKYFSPWEAINRI